jgi:hypothetical protein
LHKPGTEPLSPETIGQIVDKAAQKWGDRDALVSVHQGHRLSFRKVKEEVSRLIEVMCLLLFWLPNVFNVTCLSFYYNTITFLASLISHVKFRFRILSQYAYSS